MDLKKILGTLLIVVIFVAGAAITINVLFPNAVRVGVNVIEQKIAQGTGIDVDLDKDGTSGKNHGTSISGDNTAGTNEGVFGGNSGVTGVDN